MRYAAIFSCTNIWVSIVVAPMRRYQRMTFRRQSKLAVTISGLFLKLQLSHIQNCIILRMIPLAIATRLFYALDHHTTASVPYSDNSSRRDKKQCCALTRLYYITHTLQLALLVEMMAVLIMLLWRGVLSSNGDRRFGPVSVVEINTKI